MLLVQDEPPSVIDPDRLPGAPDMPDEFDAPATKPDMPLPNTPPMVVPPPDEDAPPSPDAFGAAPAPDTAGDADASGEETPDEKLDRLFAELRKEPSGTKAVSIASRIQRQWARSGSATVDLLMQRAAEAMQKKEDATALDMLDQAIVLEPSYAEAWNRRATLNFTMDRWGKSLADIEQTLRREPRHWGALMGLAAILQQTGHQEKALETYMRVLAIYPALKSAQDAVGDLSEKLTGPAI